MDIPRDLKLHKKRCSYCKHKCLYYPEDNNNFYVKCFACGREFDVTYTAFDDIGNPSYTVSVVRVK